MPSYTKIKRMFYLLGKLGQVSHRDDMIYESTGGRVWSAKDMTDPEADSFIERLEAMVQDHAAAAKREYDAKDPANRMRRKVISKMIEMRAIKADGKADMEWIYKFIEAKFKKGLNKMTLQELGKTISVLEMRWLPWFYQRKEANQEFTIKMVD